MIKLRQANVLEFELLIKFVLLMTIEFCLYLLYLLHPEFFFEI